LISVFLFVNCALHTFLQLSSKLERMINILSFNAHFSNPISRSLFCCSSPLTDSSLMGPPITFFHRYHSSALWAFAVSFPSIFILCLISPSLLFPSQLINIHTLFHFMGPTHSIHTNVHTHKLNVDVELITVTHKSRVSRHPFRIKFSIRCNIVLLSLSSFFSSFQLICTSLCSYSYSDTEFHLVWTD